MENLKKKTCLVVGYFGLKNNQLDGQTVKTRSIYRLLKDLDDNISFFDTHSFRLSVKNIFYFFKKLKTANKLVFLPGINGLRLIGPFLAILKLFKDVKIHYFVVGGWLPSILKEKPLLKHVVSSFDGIYVETRSILFKLRNSFKLRQTKYFPNFRWLPSKKLIKKKTGIPLKLVFLSRIIPEKGVETIFEAADIISRLGKDNLFEIDFYGPFFSSYKNNFMAQLEKKQNMNYKGKLRTEEINDTLKNYDVFLFPTYYNGEGFPGAVVDAFMSGLPVLATNWKYNSEIIENGKTGYLFEVKNAKELYEIIIKLEKNRQLLKNLQANALKRSEDFSEKVAKNLIFQYKILQV
jgi:glycosyltransferase involved in cell wall biosynthesis